MPSISRLFYPGESTIFPILSSYDFINLYQVPGKWTQPIHPCLTQTFLSQKPCHLAPSPVLHSSCSRETKNCTQCFKCGLSSILQLYHNWMWFCQCFILTPVTFVLKYFKNYTPILSAGPWDLCLLLQLLDKSSSMQLQGMTQATLNSVTELDFLKFLNSPENHGWRNQFCRST